MATKEQRFYDALRDVFVGAKVEGESGYINLMRIKSRYYQQGVFPKLQQHVETALTPFPHFREELFDRLYTFFSRYFSESGSIYFRYTPLHQNVYDKVYTDDKDVILFWKTHMLYYVKTDRLFQSLHVESGGHRFFFDVSTLEHKKANEKRNLVYAFKEKREDETLVFSVSYSERGRQTDLDDILKALKKQGIRLGEESLEQPFRVFERQSEVDYFINKNAKAFLQEQFNLWLYQYVFSGESEWTDTRIRQLQVLKDIAFKVIDFISQFEDELVKIWNKPKFALNSNYVITLDRIADRGLDLVERLLAHEGFGSQVLEWQQLGIVSADFDPGELIENQLTGKRLNAKYRCLPIDTRYFKDLELDILGLFDPLDEALDGWLINSENYQALNTILPKFREKVQTIYIDPPYNTEKDVFSYVDTFNRSSWAAMMDNRVRLARDLLSSDGSVYVHVDFHETASVRFILDDVFGADNFVNEIIWRIGWVSGFKTAGEKYVRNHETIWFYTKKTDGFFNGETIRIPYRTFTLSDDEEQLRASIERKLGMKADKFQLVLKGRDGRIYKLETRGHTREGYYPVEDIWNANEYEEINSVMIMSYTKEKVGEFLTQKPERLLRRIVEASSKEGSLVADFFLGTGTTAAAAQKLRRRWLGVELSESLFCDKTLPRMKGILAAKSKHEPCGISNEVNWQGGGFFKYYELEQYEDALRRARYDDADLFENPYRDPYSQYVFLRDLKMLDALTVDPDYNQVSVDLSKLYQNVDVPETLSNLLGKWIKRISADSVEFTDGERVDLKQLDWRLIKPLIWW